MPPIPPASPALPPADCDVQTALREVLGALVAAADARRQASDGYAHLFSAFQDGGVAKAVFTAEQQMKSIAMDLAQVLKQHAGQQMDKDLYSVLLGLPLALRCVRSDIEHAEGNSCCADKARLVLKTFFYDKLGLEIAPVPFTPSSDKIKP